MNGTSMTTTTLPGTEVAAFAAAVRSALADLPPDELDELTDGLEADLAERLEETPDASGLGDPSAYAEELRAAAGYPPRAARSHLGDTLPNLRTLPQELLRRWKGVVARHTLVAAVVDFFVVLRPVWWVARGLAVHVLLASFLGYSGTTFWWIGAGLIVLSVQVGRGRMQRWRAVPWIVRAVSAIVILASPFLLGVLATQVNLAVSQGDYSYEEMYYPQGLTLNGNPIDNIYAYDAEGQPIEQVQLFDQNGEPLNIVGDTTVPWWGAQDGSFIIPNSDVPGRAGWNVYPLAHIDGSEFGENGVVLPDAGTIGPFPVDSVKPLAGIPTTDMTDVSGSTIAGGTPADGGEG